MASWVWGSALVFESLRSGLVVHILLVGFKTKYSDPDRLACERPPGEAIHHGLRPGPVW